MKKQRIGTSEESKKRIVGLEEDSIPGFDVVEAANNRIILAFESSNKKNKVRQATDELLRLPHLGLRLEKTTSFLTSVDMVLFPQLALETPLLEKKKCSTPLKNDVLMLTIGSWKVITKNAEDIMAKCYFGKRQFVWEILENRLKKKIQIPWGHILAMRATIEENQYEVLEIKLRNPPSFFWETEPIPQKHSVWKKATDFTNGQATFCRRHCLQFPRGTLEKYYTGLLQVPELFEISRSPFPSLQQSPQFPSDLLGACDRTLNVGSFEVKNASNVAQRDMKIQEQYSTALAVTSQENLELQMNGNGFSNYLNTAKGLNNENLFSNCSNTLDGLIMSHQNHSLPFNEGGSENLLCEDELVTNEQFSHLINMAEDLNDQTDLFMTTANYGGRQTVNEEIGGQMPPNNLEDIDFDLDEIIWDFSDKY